jgi:hypothetical protein
MIAAALLVFVLLPVPARAQAEVVLQQVVVQLWPEYDQPAVLAIVDFSLAAETAFPVQIGLRIPGNATLTAVAKDENGLITVPYETSVAGDWRVVTLSIDGPESYRLEFYYSFARAGNTRSFSYTWPGDYDAKKLLIQLQEPTQIKNLGTNPAMSEPFPSSNGMILHDLVAENLSAGTMYGLDVQYDRSTDAMSAASLSVEPSGGDLATSQQTASLTTLLPYLLGGLGLLLIVGGGVWYWQSGRGVSAAPRQRRRHTAQRAANDDDDTEEDEEEKGGDLYCHQCGRRANSGDRFCRTCGARLRREE